MPSPPPFVPLQGLSLFDPLKGGYAFLDPTDNGHTYHPGVDLNAGDFPDADLGAPLILPIAGQIIATLHWNQRTTGYGNHLWAALNSSPPTYIHYAHADTLAPLSPNVLLPPGTQIGTCGKSGNQTFAHLHLECTSHPPSDFPPPYTSFWPYGYSREYVAEHYLSPKLWWLSLLTQSESPIDMQLLEDWQVKEWIMRPLWEEATPTSPPIPFNPEAAITNAWLISLRASVYRGRPLSPERPAANGSWQEFAQGIAVYQPGKEVSWVG